MALALSLCSPQGLCWIVRCLLTAVGYYQGCSNKLSKSWEEMHRLKPDNWGLKAQPPPAPDPGCFPNHQRARETSQPTAIPSLLNHAGFSVRAAGDGEELGPKNPNVLLPHPGPSLSPHCSAMLWPSPPLSTHSLRMMSQHLLGVRVLTPLGEQ